MKIHIKYANHGFLENGGKTIELDAAHATLSVAVKGKDGIKYGMFPLHEMEELTISYDGDDDAYAARESFGKMIVATQEEARRLGVRPINVVDAKETETRLS